MQIKKIILFSFFSSLIFISGCKKFNLFSVQDDINLGLQVSKEIESNRKDFPLLKEQGK